MTTTSASWNLCCTTSKRMTILFSLHTRKSRRSERYWLSSALGRRTHAITIVSIGTVAMRSGTKEPDALDHPSA